MNRFKSIFGYVTAVALFFFLMFSFIRSDILEKLIVATGIHPTEWYSGGKVITIKQCNGYVLEIHQPVFNTVYGDVTYGFVQLTFKGQPDLPDIIHQAVSIDNYDFTIETDVKTLTTKMVNPGKYAQKIVWTYTFSDKSLNVRVGLKNQKK